MVILYYLLAMAFCSLTFYGMAVTINYVHRGMGKHTVGYNRLF